MPLTYMKYLIYFLSGSILITAITLVAEKRSQKIAGILMCLPVITFLSLLFLGVSQGAEFASRAAVWNPIGAVADLVYLGLFAVGINLTGYYEKINRSSDKAKRSIELLSGLLSGFTGYFICIVILSQLPIISGWVSLLALWASAVIFYIFFKSLKENNVDKPRLVSRYDLIFRGIFGGSVVAAVVILGDSFGYIWSGLFSSFPATITPVLVLLHMRNGKDILSGVIKSSPIGLSATGLYSCMVWLLYPANGVIAGTFASYIVVLGFLSVIFFRSWLLK